MSGKKGRGTVSRTCRVCGAEFFTFVAWLRKGRAGNYCSRSCARKNQPSKKTMIHGNCVECGKEFARRKGSGGTFTFCSIQCMAANRGRRMSGENHPNWKGGMGWRSWKERKVIKIAICGKACARCGATDNLQGHHRDPAIRLAYIEALCADCHALEHPAQAGFILSHKRKRNAKELDRRGNI